MGVEYDQGRFETRPDTAEVVVQEEVVYKDAPTRRWQRGSTPEEHDESDARSERMMKLGHAAYAILRITVGAILLAHGLQKMGDVPAWVEQVRSLGVPMPATMALLSLAAEAGGGVLLILGFCTRFAAALTFINMLVAILAVHAGSGLFTKNGGYEFPLLLMMTSVLFVAEGSRRYGIDATFWRAIRRRRAASESGTQRPHYVG